MHTTPSVLESSGADDAFSKFERMREKVERAEAEADALAELRGGRDLSSADPVEFGSANDEIDIELEMLKKQQGKS